LNPLNTDFELSFLSQRGEISMPKKKSIVPVKKIEESILVIRGEKVILDSDLAALYGVTTKVLNQAVKRNIERFPKDFMFQLTEKEMAGMRSQFVTASKRNIRYLPYTFTEHGAIMAANHCQELNLHHIF